jgi:putative ATP-dependent endonuclease of the OLD family
MRLTRVEVRNYRSIFERTAASGTGLRLDVSNGLNVLVGKNNCGKSNVFRSIGAALDPNFHYDPACDNPGPLVNRYPSIQLWFDCDRAAVEEVTLLDRAAECEMVARGVQRSETRAATGRFVMRTSFAPTREGGIERRDRVVFADGSDEPGKAEVAGLLDPVIEQFRSLIRFVMVKSGESIESVLEGNFREILHTVVREQLGDEFDAAEQHRSDYVEGLQSGLLAPLRDLISEVVRKLFPEISDIRLAPDVSDIESTLSKVSISLVDAVESPLAAKGTGVRGGVLIAMLRYLAAHASRCVVFAVEEPEAFLHPAAQEILRANFESLALRNDVSVLVTTHSPFIVSRSQQSTCFYLDKDHEGRTHVGASSRGIDSKVGIVSGLMRDDSYNDLIDRSASVGEDKSAILLVEGYGDKDYLELAATALGRPELIADLEIIPTNGTTQMVFQACLARASSSLPIAALVDNDEPGKIAFEKLLSLEYERKKLFEKNKTIFSYATVFSRGDIAWEAENLFPSELIENFVRARGGTDWVHCTGYEDRIDYGSHYDLNSEAKTAFAEYLRTELRIEHLGRWQALIEKIRKGLKLPDAVSIDVADGDGDPVGYDPASDSIEADDPKPAAQVAVFDENEAVLIVAERFGHAEYLRSGVFAGDPGRGLSPDIRHVAFYEDGHIREEVPRVLARHDDLVFSEHVAVRLMKSKAPHDEAIGKFITEELASGRREEGDVRQIFLLSPPEAPETMRLPTPVVNTKTSPKGRPMAFVVRHRMSNTGAFAAAPATTHQLEELEQGAPS